jgi:16S rRNA processing protein RimM
MADDSRLLVVGRIGRPHGVTGELYIDLTTDRTERAAIGATLVVGGRDYVVVASRPHNHRFLVRLDGVDSREAAERLTGHEVRAAPIEDPEALWVDDLIGARVVEVDGTDRGRCVAVVANPAHDLLELDSGALVPVTFVVAHGAGIVTVDTPEGLFELQ